jgi:hypothetical protein
MSMANSLLCARDCQRLLNRFACAKFLHTFEKKTRENSAPLDKQQQHLVHVGFVKVKGTS